MTDRGDAPILAIKKLGAMVLIIVGLLVAGIGFNYGPSWLAILGILVLIAGIALLVLKIIRRNEGR